MVGVRCEGGGLCEAVQRGARRRPGEGNFVLVVVLVQLTLLLLLLLKRCRDICLEGLLPSNEDDKTYSSWCLPPFLLPLPPLGAGASSSSLQKECGGEY